MFLEDLLLLDDYLHQGQIVVFPKDGVGTGLANLPQGAPKTYQFLTGAISYLMTKYGVINKFAGGNNDCKS